MVKTGFLNWQVYSLVVTPVNQVLLELFGFHYISLEMVITQLSFP